MQNTVEDVTESLGNNYLTSNVPKLEGFIRDMQDKLPNLDYEGKRLALDMLGIAVWLDGENVEVTGTIEPELYALRCVSNQDNVSNVTPIPFSFRIKAGVV